MGAYVSLPTWWRNHEQRYRLSIGECRNCGERSFPPSGACPECNELHTFDEVEPDGTGKVISKTVISGAAPPEFSSYEKQEGSIGVVIVELDEGANVPGMLTDCNPANCNTGDRVESVVRRIYQQEGVVRYGFKFRPVDC
jgi:uncharacterized OB-fold protein